MLCLFLYLFNRLVGKGGFGTYGKIFKVRCFDKIYFGVIYHVSLSSSLTWNDLHFHPAKSEEIVNKIYTLTPID